MASAFSSMGDEARGKVMSLVAKKIEVLTGLQDEVLLEFIEQLLDNEKTPDEMKEDLADILKDHTDSFLDWLFFTIAKTADSEGKNSSKVAGLNEQPWSTFEKLLNLTFVLWCNGADINWQAEAVKLRQAVMSGLALNTNQPCPPPSSEKYPPLLVLKQMNTWLKKFDFPSQSSTSSSSPSNAIFTDEGFRNYLMGTLHTMGFILSHMIESEGENDPKEQYLAPIAEPASELFVILVKGCTDVFAKASSNKESASGIALYEKYKRLTGNTSTAESTPAPEVEDSLVEDLKMFLSALAPPMAEIFGRSANCRAVLRKHEWFEVTKLLRKENPRIAMLYDLSNTIDEDFIVIHAGEKKGYRAYISGCSDNKELGLALAANLIQSDAKEDSLLSGSRPNQSFISILSSTSEQEPSIPDKYSHPWSFSSWTVVKPDGTVPSGLAGASHWIWADGVPKQIPAWKGTRVLILQKVPFPKPFFPIRMFGGMDAIVKKVLTSEEVDAMLKEMGQTTDEARQEAIKYHKSFQS